MASILTNTSAMIALQNLRSINSDLAKVQEQISTGKKVGSARDNAAVFAISTVMDSDVKGFQAISESLNLGQSTLNVASGAAEQITSLLTDMKGLIVAAQEENVDRTKIQNDISQLRDQIGSIVDAASFNGLNLVKGSGTVSFLSSLDRDSGGSVTASSISVTRQNMEVSAGAAFASLDTTNTTGVNAGGNAAAALVADTNTFRVDIDSALNTADADVGKVIEISVQGRTFSHEIAAGDDTNTIGQQLTNQLNAAGLSNIAVAYTPGVDPALNDSSIVLTNNTGAAVAFEANAHDGTQGGLGTLSGLDVSTGAGASAALASIEGLIQTAVDASAALGSAGKRIDIQSEFVSNLTDSLKTGIGALVDADLEEASARLQSLQVQQQLGVQALSIANQSSNSILALFQ